MIVIWILGIATVLVAVLVVLHLGASWMEARGWIYYRRRPPTGAAALAALQVSEIFKPELEYVIEEHTSGSLRTTDDEIGLGDLPGR